MNYLFEVAQTAFNLARTMPNLFSMSILKNRLFQLFIKNVKFMEIIEKRISIDLRFISLKSIEIDIFQLFSYIVQNFMNNQNSNYYLIHTQQKIRLSNQHNHYYVY